MRPYFAGKDTLLGSVTPSLSTTNEHRWEHIAFPSLSPSIATRPNSTNHHATSYKAPRDRRIILGHNDVVKVARYLLPAFVAVRTEPYAERTLHARLQRPAVERVPGARVARSLRQLLLLLLDRHPAAVQLRLLLVRKGILNHEARRRRGRTERRRVR